MPILIASHFQPPSRDTEAGSATSRSTARTSSIADATLPFSSTHTMTIAPATPPLRQRLVEDGPREAVDLDDQQSSTPRHRRLAEPRPTDEAIEGTLQPEGEVVDGHASLL